MKFFLYIIIFSLMIYYSEASSVDAKPKPKVGINEKLGNQIPSNILLTNSDGKEFKIGDYITKPTILALVYYHCPGVCTPLLTGLADVVDKVDLKPGVDFQVLTVSFDHKETPPIAAKWKKEYLSSLKRNFNPTNWRFTTGDSLNVKRLANSVGYYYIPAGEDDFIHSAALIILTPDGKVSRYLFGTDFLKADLKLALTEAGDGKFLPTINKMLQYCFAENPSGDKYILSVKKISGVVIFLAIGTFFLVLVLRGKNKKNMESI